MLTAKRPMSPKNIEKKTFWYLAIQRNAHYESGKDIEASYLSL